LGIEGAESLASPRVIPGVCGSPEDQITAGNHVSLIRTARSAILAVRPISDSAVLRWQENRPLWREEQTLPRRVEERDGKVVVGAKNAWSSYRENPVRLPCGGAVDQPTASLLWRTRFVQRDLTSWWACKTTDFLNPYLTLHRP